MERIKPYFLAVLLFPAISLIAQQKAGPPVTTSFPDSVRIVLERTRNNDATVIGGIFVTAWQSLNVNQQALVQRQIRAMRRKKTPLKPHIVDYLGAVGYAVTLEKATPEKVEGFLNVVTKVIDMETPPNTANFFKVSRTFFEYHALNFEKPFRLYSSNDDYAFEYIEPTPAFDMNDTAASAPTADAGYTEPASSDNTDMAFDTTYVEAPPLWMNPQPQPIAEGPVLRFNRATLTLVTRYDSVSLSNTKGVVALRSNLFIGQDGSFEWISAGLGPDQVTCNMVAYNFNIRRPEIKSDLVKLNYAGKTPGYIPGTFEFRSESRTDSAYSSFPRFRSFQNSLAIQGIGDENVKYKGGFSLIGNKITSASVTGDPSTIEIYHNNEKKLTARSSDFAFTDSTIVAQRSTVNIPIDNDSITHPAVRLKYTFGKDSTQRIVLQKDKGLMKHTPYSASFFNIDFAADRINWDLYSDSLNMQTEGGRNIVPFIIESIDFYDPEDYRLLSGQGFSFHPLGLVASYCLKNKVRDFYSGDLINFSKKKPQDIKAAIEFLSEKGLVTYFPKSDLVHVKDKAILLYKAQRGDMDYDNLKIHSVIDSFPNATLNFDKRYMIVRGVEEFKISDSLNVRIQPDSSVITILQNRDIQFDGTITAGNFEISGKGFTLKYNEFLIGLTHIDSINFYVSETNARGQTVRRKVNNSMVPEDSLSANGGGLNAGSSSGTLYISKANNKSGKKKEPNFPRLDAASGGVIYFDREEVLGGAYDRSMYFVVPPFKLDSLNNTDPASISLLGTFNSGGMFPTFKEKLHTQPDKSLGFDHTIPKSGYQLYNGNGKMTGEITMNSRGLRGTGRIDYYAATVNANDIVFYPDSVISRGMDAGITGKQFGAVDFPDASLSDFEMKWYPKTDQMKIKNMKSPFNFYQGSAQMQGTVTISKDGAAGTGKLVTRGTELISRTIKFNSKDFSAEHARFKVNSENPDKPLLQGTNVNLKFNLDENFADISPEVKGSPAITFPYAQVKTSIPEMHLDLNAQKITMRRDPDVPLEDSYFYTTRKELDSLSFNAESAEYDLKKQELKVNGIPYIIVADAKITPENNEVLILENAKIGTLKNTTIILDTLNGYHRLTDGVVDIISRKEFTGHATYQYVNFHSDTFAIKMTDFRLEPVTDTEQARRSAKRKSSQAKMQTVATGAVSDQENLVLGARMYYKGDMIMYATRPALQLDGYVKLDIKKIKDYNTWIKYDQTGDETDIMIDFNNAVTEQGQKATAGLHVGSDNNLYISFMSNKKSDDDEDFFLPEGKLYYDTATLEFKIEDPEKANGNKLSGKVFAYKDETMQVRFEGPVNLLQGTKDFNVTASALGQANLETNEIRMNSFLMVDTSIPPTAFDLMGKQIQDIIKNEGADEGLGDQTELLYKIADFIGERAVKDYEQKSLQGYVSLGTIAQLAKPLVFSNVNLKWSEEHKAFYSEGKLGMSNIGRNDINGAFEGFMEIKKTEDGVPVFHVFVKASPDAWYYFGLEDNRLLVQSSNSEFNSIIAKKTNAGKSKIGEIAFVPGSDEETLAFINRFRKEYFNNDVPYSLSEPTSIIKKADGEKKKEEDDGF